MMLDGDGVSARSGLHEVKARGGERTLYPFTQHFMRVNASALQECGGVLAKVITRPSSQPWRDAYRERLLVTMAGLTSLR